MDGGSWIAFMVDGAATQNGELPVLDIVHIAGGVVEDIRATDIHVYVVFGDQGLRIFGRDGGALTELGVLSEGFD